MELCFNRDEMRFYTIADITDRFQVLVTGYFQVAITNNRIKTLSTTTLLNSYLANICLTTII